MRDKKYYIALYDFERRVVVNCLNEMRNNLIANGKYTNAVEIERFHPDDYDEFMQAKQERMEKMTVLKKS